MRNEYFILLVFSWITRECQCVGLYIQLEVLDRNATRQSRDHTNLIEVLANFTVDDVAYQVHRCCGHCAIRDIANIGMHPTLKTAECTSDTLDRSGRRYTSHRRRCSEVSVGHAATFLTEYVPLRCNLVRKTTQSYDHNQRMA